MALTVDTAIRSALIEARDHILKGDLDKADVTFFTMNFSRLQRSILESPRAASPTDQTRIRETASHIDDSWGAVLRRDAPVAKGHIDLAIARWDESVQEFK